MTRRLVANLEAELEWSLEERGAAAPPRGLARPNPADLAYLGIAMAACASPNDELLLMGPSDHLEPGPLLLEREVKVIDRKEAKRSPTDKLVLWGLTRCGLELGGATITEEKSERLDDLRLLAERASFAGAWEDFPTWGDIHSEADLRAALAELSQLDESEFGAVPKAWVLKARWGSAGRTRLRGRGEFDEIPSSDRVRLQRLFELGAPLWLEPWVEIEMQFGLGGIANADSRPLTIWHRSRAPGHGAPSSIEYLDPWSSVVERDEFSEAILAFEFVEGCLQKAAYEGPFGIDVWRWRDAQGNRRVRAIAECNLRMTFGHLAFFWRESDREHGSRSHCNFLLAAPVEELDEVIVFDRNRQVGMGLVAADPLRRKR